MHENADWNITFLNHLCKEQPEGDQRQLKSKAKLELKYHGYQGFKGISCFLIPPPKQTNKQTNK